MVTTTYSESWFYITPNFKKTDSSNFLMIDLRLIFGKENGEIVNWILYASNDSPSHEKITFVRLGKQKAFSA